VSVNPGRALLPGKGPPVPIVQEAGWASEPVWTQRLGEKFFRLCRGSNPDHPVVQSVVKTPYWLSYSGFFVVCVVRYNKQIQVKSNHIKCGQLRWWWRQYAPLKRRSSTKAVIFIFAAELEISHFKCVTTKFGSEIMSFFFVAWINATQLFQLLFAVTKLGRLLPGRSKLKVPGEKMFTSMKSGMHCEYLLPFSPESFILPLAV
jgi:hypothetical protein